MKKITFKMLLGVTLLFSAMGNAQCLTAVEGQYPTSTTPVAATTCDGLAVVLVTDLGWASEYSIVSVTAGETYTFSSSVATDYITIGSEDGTTSSISGVTPVTWVSDVDGIVRFYTHTDELCGASRDEFRARTFVCGVPPCIQPHATFAKVSNCPDATFNVTADITDLGSATSITVTDDQGSSSQTVSAIGLVTFGPYANGTSVILTATNDDTPVCNVVSEAQTQVACPQENDECANAVTLACGDALSNQTTEGASGGSETSCVGTIGDDVWYTFVGTGDIITLTATATNGEGPQVEVYESTDGTCAGFTPGSCFASAGTGDTTAVVVFASTVGTTYYTHIGNWINGFPAVAFDLTMGCEAPPTAPANDDCAGAYTVVVNPDASCASVTAGSLFGATASSVDALACGGTPDDDIWFSFVATGTSQTINLNNIVGTNTDLFHSVWSGTCGGLTLVAGSCSDANNSRPSGLTIGETYYIRVYSYTATPLQDITFDVCVGTPPPPPANDECANAITLACGDVLSGQYTDGATGGTGTSCIGTIGDDVWYTFIGNGQDTVLSAVSTNGEGPQVEVYESTDGTCAGFTAGTCFASDGTGDTSASVSFTAALGTTYYIHIGNWINGNPAVIFDLSMTCNDAPPVPANDLCADAVALTVGNSATAFPVTGTTAGASTTTGLGTFACQTNRNSDVWYSVVVPASGILSIATSAVGGSLMDDSVVSVFSGSCGSLFEIGCADDNVDDTFSTVDLSGLTAGDTLYVGVWKYDTTDAGEFQIAAYDTTLGTSTFDSANFKAYPNPVSNVLNLTYNKNITAVTVYNLLGQEVMAKALNANFSQIDMSHLSSGTYMVKVFADNQVNTIKVVKQ